MKESFYKKANQGESFYQNAAFNSYCHAWSCTPAFFFRKYGGK